MTQKVELADGTILEFPDGTSLDVIQKAAKRIIAGGAQPPAAQAAAPIAGAGQPVSADSNFSAMTPVRSAEFFGRGSFDSLGDLAAAPLELSASAMRGLGLTNQRPGYFRDKIGEAGKAVGGVLNAPLNAALDASGAEVGPNRPVGSLEKGAYGAGRGAGDAASIMVPGGALLRTAKAGSTAANVGKTLVAQPGLQVVAGGTGGATTELTDSPLTGTAASMLTALSPSLALGAVKRVARPIKDQMSRQGKNVVEAAEREGIKLTAGQATNSKTLRNVEAGLAELPLSASAQGQIYAGQHQAFNRAVLRKAGIDSDDAGPDVINKAYTSIGKEFDDLASRTKVSIDKKFFDDIDEITRKFASKLKINESPIVRSIKEEFDGYRGLLNKSPRMEGPEFQRISSEFKELARAQKDGSWAQKTLYKYASALDDALERSFTPTTSTGTQVSVKGSPLAGRQVSTQVNRGEQSGLLEQWKSVRNRYRNLLQIDKAVRGGDAASEVAGDIPFGSFKTAVKSFDPGYGRGRGDFNDLSRIASLLQSSIPPNSGTAARQLMQRSLQGEPIGKAMRQAAITGGSTTAGGTAGFMLGGPIGAAVGAAGALTLPKGIQMMMNTPGIQSWLKNTRNIPAPERDKMLRTLLQKVYAAQGVGDLTNPRED